MEDAGVDVAVGVVGVGAESRLPAKSLSISSNCFMRVDGERRRKSVGSRDSSLLEEDEEDEAFGGSAVASLGFGRPKSISAGGEKCELITVNPKRI